MKWEICLFTKCTEVSAVRHHIAIRHTEEPWDEYTED